MGKVLSSFGTSRAITETETVTSGGDGSETGDIIDGTGTATHLYNDVTGDATTGVTFIKTGLGRVDEALVEISTELGGLTTGTTTVEARPAVESDFENDSDFVPGTILLILRDASDGTEVADDTSIENLELTYNAVRN